MNKAIIYCVTTVILCCILPLGLLAMFEADKNYNIVQESKKYEIKKIDKFTFKVFKDGKTIELLEYEE